MDKKFEQAMAILEDATNRLTEARKAFKEIGIDVGTVFDSNTGKYGSIDIWLKAGITTLSTMSETPIESSGSSDVGHIMIDGYEFRQVKIPVEREDRYA